MSFKRIAFIIAIILIADQCSKIYVKTHFQLYEDLELISWFRIVFVENEGMAWGARLSDFIPFIATDTAKLMLTLFRIAAVLAIAYWLFVVVKTGKSKVLALSIAVIFAGAMGNIIDSVFYGILFSDSYGQLAEILPPNGGYAGLFYGNVVDMLHFPLWSGELPEWIPWIGGDYVSFFDPVFNIADVAITSGIIALLLFSKKAFS